MLNERLIAKLKPSEAQYSVAVGDPKLPGLALRVNTNGSMPWTLRYRAGRHMRRMTVGWYPRMSLADARKEAARALRQVDDGHDPQVAKQERRQAGTFADLATDYIERYAKKHKRSWKADQRILTAEVLPEWKHRKIADIRRRDVRELVYAIAERGAPILANRTTALLSKVFNFALDEDTIEVSPAVRIKRPAPEQKRDRVLSENEIRQLWASFEALSPALAAFYKLRLVTGQRGGEVSSMRWQDLDLEASSSCWWTIPAERSKNKLPHRVPLNSMAVEILTGLRARRDEILAARAARGDTRRTMPIIYVLAGGRGKRQQSDAAATFTVPDFEGHDLRRTAASLMAGGGIPRLTISKILNHVESGVTAVYDRHSYDAEKRAALDWWAVKLTAILENKPARVLPFTMVK